jgi:hypothetical protein
MVQTRVQFIHGLEGSPQGTKARVLSQHFETLTPAMDTSANTEIEDERKPSIPAGLDRMKRILCAPRPIPAVALITASTRPRYA